MAKSSPLHKQGYNDRLDESLGAKNGKKSKSAKKGSVRVEELCKVSSFKQVHQMISTVVSELKDDVHLVDVIKDTFPMGSMTGAPKISAMKIIEDLEETKRGLYSGTVGYFTPNGDFDFHCRYIKN